jgi:L-aspartate semialdehyde sulfurtransferase
MPKTVGSINDKIRSGSVTVLTAEEMTRLVQQVGPDEAAETVDVVTTGTFGAMCSSGVWLNFGHADPPIKMTKVKLNGVEAYTGVAAVDAYIGATQPSESEGIAYGGAQVIEDLVRGRPIVLHAVSYGTDCYPRKELLTEITIHDLNQALMSNPRNAYQRYHAATNSSDRALNTYMGRLLPHCGNVTYSGAGALSPLVNDPEARTIGVGTRILLGGAPGFVVGGGTQHDPEAGFATLMVHGDLREMSAEYLRAATFPGYGCTLYVGIGVPIPVLDADLARRTGISDAEIATRIVDYGVPTRERPHVAATDYAALKSGSVEISGRRVKTAALSSLEGARRVAEELKRRILAGAFLLSVPAEGLTRRGAAHPMAMRGPSGRRRAAHAGEGRHPHERRHGGNGTAPRRTRSAISIDRERCVHCGLCLSLCPTDAFALDDRARVVADFRRCTRCGECADACPLGAIVMRGAR